MYFGLFWVNNLIIDKEKEAQKKNKKNDGGNNALSNKD